MITKQERINLHTCIDLMLQAGDFGDYLEESGIKISKTTRKFLDVLTDCVKTPSDEERTFTADARVPMELIRIAILLGEIKADLERTPTK